MGQAPMINFDTKERKMIWIILGVILVVWILIGSGIFRKPCACHGCGRQLKGVEQEVFGSKSTIFVLCNECAKKIHPLIREYARKAWADFDFDRYLAWDNETREERAQFQVTDKYGNRSTLKIDVTHGLFALSSDKISLSDKPDLVLRFADLDDWDLNFRPMEVKEGFLSDHVKGDEFATVRLSVPNIFLDEKLNSGVSYSIRRQGIFKSRYEYDLSPSFQKIIATFSICDSLEYERQKAEFAYTERDFDEVQKALALFMFDSMADVTPDNLKKQRDALIRTFHPDNGEDNAAYAAKINQAYEVLSELIRKQ